MRKSFTAGVLLAATLATGLAAPAWAAEAKPPVAAAAGDSDGYQVMATTCRRFLPMPTLRNRSRPTAAR